MNYKIKYVQTSNREYGLFLLKVLAVMAVISLISNVVQLFR